MDIKSSKGWAVVVAQLVERLLLTLDICSSNHDIGKIFYTSCKIEKAAMKKMIGQQWSIFKKEYLRYTAKPPFSYCRAKIILSKLTKDLLCFDLITNLAPLRMSKQAWVGHISQAILGPGMKEDLLGKKS